MSIPDNEFSGVRAVRRPRDVPRRKGPRWSTTPRAIWGRLCRANARFEASFLGDVVATALFAFLAYALFFIGGILQ